MLRMFVRIELLTVLTIVITLAYSSPSHAYHCVKSTKPKKSPMATTKYVTNGPQIIETLSENPIIMSLFNARLKDGTLIKKHVLTVFAILAKQLPYYREKLKGLNFPKKVRIPLLFAYVIALHDIGKPLADFNGHRERQHKYNVPILESVLMEHGFNYRERKIAHALVNNSIFGDLLQGRTTVNSTIKSLQKWAKFSGLGLTEYTYLRAIFYIADAGSHAVLKDIFVIKSNGQMAPKSAEFEEVLTHIEQL